MSEKAEDGCPRDETVAHPRGMQMRRRVVNAYISKM